MLNNTNKSKKIQVFYNQQGKIIGKLENGILSKVIKGSIHKLRKPPSICWDESVIEEAEELGAKETQVIDSETQTKFKSTLDVFKKYGIHIDRGYGKQIALPLAIWTIDDLGNQQLKLF